MPTLETTLTDEEIAQLPQDVTIELAGLSQGAQDQVVEALAVAHDTGTLADVDLDHTIADAQIADSARSNVETLHQEQADAVASGDYAQAHDLATATEYQLHEVQDHGGEADAQLVTTESDQAHLDWAQYHAEIAQSAANDVAHDVNTGDVTHAEQDATVVATQSDSAAHEAGAADQGGHYADHSYDSAASTSPDTDAPASE